MTTASGSLQVTTSTNNSGTLTMNPENIPATAVKTEASWDSVKPVRGSESTLGGTSSSGVSLSSNHLIGRAHDAWITSHSHRSRRQSCRRGCNAESPLSQPLIIPSPVWSMSRLTGCHCYFYVMEMNGAAWLDTANSYDELLRQRWCSSFSRYIPAA